MTFTEFAAAYRNAFAAFIAAPSLSPESIAPGNILGALDEAHPAWAEEVQTALDAEHYAVYLQLTQESR